MQELVGVADVKLKVVSGFAVLEQGVLHKVQGISFLKCAVVQSSEVFT